MIKSWRMCVTNPCACACACVYVWELNKSTVRQQMAVKFWQVSAIPLTNPLHTLYNNNSH